MRFGPFGLWRNLGLWSGKKGQKNSQVKSVGFLNDKFDPQLITDSALFLNSFQSGLLNFSVSSS